MVPQTPYGRCELQTPESCDDYSNTGELSEADDTPSISPEPSQRVIRSVGRTVSRSVSRSLAPLAILDKLEESPPESDGPGPISASLDALPRLSPYRPAITEAIGVLRLPEVQAGIDVARIATPSMGELHARLLQSIVPAQSIMSASAALYEHRQVIEAVNSMAVQMAPMTQLSESVGRLSAAIVDWAGAMAGSIGRVDAAIAEWAVSMRRTMAELDLTRRYAAPLSWDPEKWMEANPVWPLVYDVVAERDGWEESLSRLAQYPELAFVIEIVKQRVNDSYTATIIVRLALRQVIRGMRSMSSSAMPPKLLPYLQRAVQDMLSGQQQLLLPGLTLSSTGKKRGGGPVRHFETREGCEMAVIDAIRVCLRAGRGRLQERVAERLGFSTSGLRWYLREYSLAWENLVAAARR